MEPTPNCSRSHPRSQAKWMSDGMSGPGADVRTLLGNDDIINAMALDVFREYNTDQMIAVNLPEASGQVRDTNPYRFVE